MDIYEKYDEEDIQYVKDEMQYILETEGIVELAEYIYELDVTIELYEKTRRQKIKPYRNEEEKAKQENDYEDAKIKLDIFENDEEIHEQIAETLEDLEYDEEDEDSRINVITQTLEVFNLLSNEDGRDLECVKNAINNKIEEMSNTDFILMFADIGFKPCLLNHPDYIETVKEKFLSMKNEEFAIVLLYIDDQYCKCGQQIKSVIKEIVEERNNAVINMSYEYISTPEDKIKIENKKSLDPLAEIYFSEEDEKIKDEIIRNLTPKEFVRYCLLNTYIVYNGKQRTEEHLKVFQDSIKKLSENDFLVILEQFYPEEGTEKQWDENISLLKQDIKLANSKDVFYEVYPIMSYLIIKEARARNLIDSNFKRHYSLEKQENMEKQIKAVNTGMMYDEMAEDDKINLELPEFDYVIEEDDVLKAVGYNEENDEDNIENKIDDDTYEEFENRILLKRFELANESLEENIKLLKDLDKISELDDKGLCQIANIYNSKINIKDMEKEPQIQCLINYMKKRIISLPTKYVNFFVLKPYGCLNTVMKEKADELSYYTKRNLENEEITK